ncbi:protein phosphatase 2C domain-containing protein [Streptomyces fructofermentans]
MAGWAAHGPWTDAPRGLAGPAPDTGTGAAPPTGPGHGPGPRAGTGPGRAGGSGPGPGAAGPGGAAWSGPGSGGAAWSGPGSGADGAGSGAGSGAHGSGARQDGDGPGRGAAPAAGSWADGSRRGAPPGARPGADASGRAPEDPPGDGPGAGGSPDDTLGRSGLRRQPAPWEAPPPVSRGPASFPPGPNPPPVPDTGPRGGGPAGPSGGAVPPARVPYPRSAPSVPPASPPPPSAPAPGPRSAAGDDREPHPRAAAGRVPEPPAAPPADTAAPEWPPRPAGRPAAGPPPPEEPKAVAGPGGRPAGPGPGDPYGPSATLVDAPQGTGQGSDPPAVPEAPGPVGHVGSGPPTYDAEPTALPAADPDALDDLVPDTVLDGASYGTCVLRAASVRGDSARYRGEPRRDALLTARFGTGDGALLLVAMATGARATPGAHRAAAEACRWIGRAVGRSHARLAEDIRAARRGDLKSGLHRLTDRSLGRLRASAAEQGVEPEEYTAGLRCLLLPADPECRTRVFFGVGAGGLFRLRDGEWQDIEPRVADTAGEPVVGFGSLPHESPAGDRLTMDLGITTPPSPYEPAPEPPARDPFRFRASVARPGDTLLLCTGGLADPLRGEPRLVEHLSSRWSGGGAPGLAAFLADTQVRVKGYADDRTAAAVWEA